MALRLPRPSPRVWLALLLVALGAVLTLVEQRDVRAPGPVPTDSAGEPDFYLEGVTLTRFDAQGRPHQRLETPRLVHTPHDDTTRADTPRTRLLDDDGELWRASGRQGTLGPGGNPLVLSGAAHLESPGEGWQLNTETLNIDTDTNHAWSDSEARITQSSQRVRGDRLDVWFDDDRLQLTGNVRGFHPPEEQAP
ncbi:LPS export ABC transporter periplasmic protein LptC [Halomonas sp. YLGW01]|uniref:LPS export ABC transporter periplasmic protein LptC n=1 Tax=Halomonas sp. YLGW01 TaxID=2773308 RepID=UPI001787422C|nr:LPS export ABC transporter periplasmic protein LptC [Halomonas sp. YLGW01]